MGEKRVTILLPSDLDEWIGEMAKREDRSFAAQLRFIVRKAKDAEAWNEAIATNREAQEA